MTETTESKRLARLQALETVAEAARIMIQRQQIPRSETVAVRNALAALDDLPAAPARGEVVEVAVWEYPDGEILQARAGSNMDRHYQAVTPWTRLGIVRLLLVKGEAPR
jgi:hypothetical protein